MGYTIDKVMTGAFDEVEAKVREALAEAGFGVLTEINLSATMKAKLDKDMPRYKILGACNPKLAYEAIGVAPRIGAMLPCNVVLREVEDGIEVSAVDPVASMLAVENDDLIEVASQVRQMLADVVAKL
ncbi:MULTISPECIES: DUF302 domain-containing protein [Thioclava]|uniref:DUF302 domain-containing protein n=1 Tax=Thioclava TaxID=285107 RepID=UPI000C68652F|nr:MULTISPECIES: DUF302 domain-containing protein [Thioclava]MAQ38287.1 hypothetical protein [Thioclava sp.]|tara:strand:- start:1483 stop:1866 length:384 start_codon:yes stop_codon:yes gene_type:complete